MKLVSKKNGTTTIFPNFISALASKIGFTPPSGMSSTNVQDAIEEIVSYSTARQCNLGSVDANNTATFIIPTYMFSDAGVYIIAIANRYGAGKVGIARIYSNNNSMNISTIIESEYFTLTSVSKNQFSITAGSADATRVILTRLAW